MSKHTRVNITRVLNTKAAKKDKRNGRDVIIVPSATLPDDVIMNRIKYPAEEIKKSYKGLEKAPAPFNHPTVGGKFVSARSPEGINQGWIGAWNENVRQENGRVFLDKIIDVEVANRSPEGKRVLEAIEKGKPIHTSTGLVGEVEKVNDAKDHDMVIRNMEFDHDAILLDFAGAATPEQGVGIFVNSDGSTEEIEVVNSIWEDADRELDWALDSIVRSLEKKARFPIVEKIKAAITEAFTGSGAEVTANQEEAEMSKTIDELSAQVTALTESMNKLGTTIVDGVSTAFANALKPLVDAQTAVLNNEKAKEEAEKAKLVDRVVKANLLTEDIAKESPMAVLQGLVANLKEPDNAAPIRPGQMQTNGGSVVTKFKAPAAEKGAA
jgi:polyhydroxyalkanoate synthesis regulator phasin